jgi:hypothetical protein
MPPESLAELLQASVQATLESSGRARPDIYTDNFSRLEQARLVELLQDWLAREQQRAPFRVLHLEQRDQARIGPLTLKVRADRVDELADGRVVVIDYKSGRGQRTATWTQERLEEPQVPLYAVQHGERLAAAAIARVRIDKDGGFKGLAEGDGLLPGLKGFKGTDSVPDWHALNAHWRARLTSLAEEVVAGRADPTPSAQACGYCDLAALCRVALLDAADQDNGGASDD